jgi:hypothetical protein
MTPETGRRGLGPLAEDELDTRKGARTAPTI